MTITVRGIILEMKLEAIFYNYSLSTNEKSKKSG